MPGSVQRTGGDREEASSTPSLSRLWVQALTLLPDSVGQSHSFLIVQWDLRSQLHRVRERFRRVKGAQKTGEGQRREGVLLLQEGMFLRRAPISTLALLLEHRLHAHVSGGSGWLVIPSQLQASLGKQQVSNMSLSNGIILTRLGTFTEQHRSSSQSQGAWVQIWAVPRLPWLLGRGNPCPPASVSPPKKDSAALTASASVMPGASWCPW